MGADQLASNSVVSASIVDGSIVNADINASAAIAGTKISPDFGSQNISTTGNIEIDSDSAELRLGDGQDFSLLHNGTDNKVIAANGGLLVQSNTYSLRNENGSSTYATINSSGLDITGNLDVGSGVDVTGNITVTGTVDGVDVATRDTLFGGLTSSSGVLTDGVTATTQSAGDNSTKVATTAYTDTAISNLVNSAPSTLDTLGEIATALNLSLIHI